MPGPFDANKERLEEQLRAQPLALLVWGSGTSAREHYEKREKIRASLAEHFANSEVRFSEELGEFVPGSRDVSIAQQEEYQLAAADACVVLDTSAGPAAEIAYFARSPLKYKLLVFTHERYKDSGGFPADLREGLAHYFYSDEEYRSCSLISRVVDRMRHVALNRLLGGVLRQV